jgi:hypothetical protein
MREKIAVEANLTPVKDFLSKKGYTVESVNFSEDSSQKLNNYDAFVITGLNKNFMGMSNIDTKAVVIDATGMTPNEVFDDLKSRFT